jgi:tetratricopeptide (TPR) repeat protein
VVLVAAGVVLGTVIQASFEQSVRTSFSPDLIRDKDPQVAAQALLDGALILAGSGSWERIAVARAWYLGGNKIRGQEILDSVTSRRGVESSDWFRIGRLYNEAGEWDRAVEAFERALEMKRGDDSGTIEYAAWANLRKDREKAEALFERIMTKDRRDFWHWVTAGGSYLGVSPQ